MLLNINRCVFAMLGLCLGSQLLISAQGSFRSCLPCLDMIIGQPVGDVTGFPRDKMVFGKNILLAIQPRRDMKINGFTVQVTSPEGKILYHGDVEGSCGGCGKTYKGAAPQSGYVLLTMDSKTTSEMRNAFVYPNKVSVKVKTDRPGEQVPVFLVKSRPQAK